MTSVGNIANPAETCSIPRAREETVGALATDADDASAEKDNEKKTSNSNHIRSKRNNGDGNNTATTTTGSAVAEDAPRP